MGTRGGETQDTERQSLTHCKRGADYHWDSALSVISYSINQLNLNRIVDLVFEINCTHTHTHTDIYTVYIQILYKLLFNFCFISISMKNLEIIALLRLIVRSKLIYKLLDISR